MTFTEKQQQIIITAESLFAENGFDATSVRDIAEKAGINVAMISYYFGSKEKLLEGIFLYRAGDTLQKLAAILANKDAGPLEKVYSMIDYYVEKFLVEQNYYKVMMREQVSLRHGSCAGQILDFKVRSQEIVKQLVTEGQRAGVFKKPVDVTLLMPTLVGTVWHLVGTQHIYREMNNLKDVPDDQFRKQLQKKISTHLKFIFKSLLTHEA